MMISGNDDIVAAFSVAAGAIALDNIALPDVDSQLRHAPLRTFAVPGCVRLAGNRNQWASPAEPTVRRPESQISDLTPVPAPDQSTNKRRGSLSTVVPAPSALSSASVLTHGAAGICSTVAC